MGQQERFHIDVYNFLKCIYTTPSDSDKGHTLTTINIKFLEPTFQCTIYAKIFPVGFLRQTPSLGFDRSNPSITPLFF